MTAITYIESVTQQWRKSAPPILSTNHCEFNGTRSCTHAQKTIPLVPIHPFTKQIVPSLCPESLPRSLSQSSSPVLCEGPIKCFLPSITFYVCVIFFFHFHRTLFCGLEGACVNPGIFLNSLFMRSPLCQITHSFLNGF